MENHSPKLALKTIRIIHFALVAAPVLFGIVVLFLNTTSPASPPQGMELLLYLPAVMLLTVFPVSGVLFHQSLKQAREGSPTLSAKMAAFQTAHIIRMALFEATALLAAVVSFITGTNYNLGIILIVVAIFISKAPSMYAIETSLGLSPEEKGQFDQ